MRMGWGLSVAAWVGLCLSAAATATAGDPPEQNPVPVSSPAPPVSPDGAVAAPEAPAPPSAEEVSAEIGQQLVYSVNRIAEPVFQTARAVQVITAEDARRRGARTLPEALMEEVGVFVQQTNYGGGSPIIRGLMGKQVLILLNGVKVNTATYRFGPVQYLSTIDLAMVDRIEIVRGLGSVLGSDAMGGVINVITRRGPPTAADGALGAGVQGRYSSADRAHAEHAEVYGQGARHRFLVGATYRSAADVDGGGTLGRQQGTGYDEAAGHANFDFSFNPDRTFSLAYDRLQQDDVPRTDRIASGTNLVFDFDPQRLQMLTASYQDMTRRSWAGSMRVTAYWNRQDEGQHEIRTRTPTVRSDLTDRQDAYGLNAELSWFPGAGRHRLVYGVDYSSEKIHSARADVNLTTGAATARRGTWTDGATYETLAFYAQDRFDLGTLATLKVGGRYGRFSSGGQENSSVGVLDLHSTNDDVTGSVNLVVHAGSHVNLIGSFTSGFRAPNLDDISIFDQRPEGTEVPNTAIEPERIRTYEAGMKFSGARLEGSAFYYRSDLRDLLTRAPGILDGLSFFDLNGNGLQEAKEPAVLLRQNLGRATIDGVEVDAHWRPFTDVTVFGTFTRTVGDDTVANVPMSRIPPAFGTGGARWTRHSPRRPWAEIVYVFAAAQRRLSPADKSDVRIGLQGTDAFHVFNVRGGVSLGRVRAALALENLGDERYKYHGSGVYRPGRQAVLSTEVRF